MTDKSRHLKRGLILAGGGAKGAFSFALIKQLKNAGVKFDAVAGTSVGALNALLFATDEIDKFDDIWSTISFSKVFKFRVLSSLIFPLINVMHVITNIYNELPPLWFKKESALQLATKILYIGYLTTTWVVVFSFPVLRYGAEHPIVGINCFVGMMLSPLFLSIILGSFLASKFSSSAKIIRELLWTHNIYLAFLSCTFLYSLTTLQLSVTEPLILPSIIILLNILLPRIAKFLTRFTILSPTPLEKEITRISAKKLNLPIYVTSTQTVDLIDPDYPNWNHIPSLSDLDDHVSDKWILRPRSAYSPKYIYLNELCQSDRIQAVLSSAALPFGISPSVFFKQVEFVDGGIIDNVPIFPLISEFYCDELLVIHLTPKNRFSDICSDYKAKWLEIKRLMLVMEHTKKCGAQGTYDMHPNPSYQRRKGSKRVIQAELPDNWPKMYSIFPDDELGSILNFNRDHIDRLMRLGQKAAQQFLLDHPDWAS